MNTNEYINSIRFHPNHSNLFVATNKGFAILNVSKGKNEIFCNRRDINKDISIVSQMGYSDKFGLVQTFLDPKKQDQFIGWDERYSFFFPFCSSKYKFVGTIIMKIQIWCWMKK